jgi:hypothetical protein
MVKGERWMAESWLSSRTRQTNLSSAKPVSAHRAARGRTGCTAVPQYEVFAKVIQ